MTVKRKVQSAGIWALCAANRWVVTLLALSWILTVPVGQASAQEDSAEDHGSRAVKKSSAKKKAKKKRRKKDDRFEWGYEAGLFGGTYLEEADWGPVANAELSGAMKVEKHTASVALDYNYDAFSTKTFNFPEEEVASTRSRLTRYMHEVAAVTKYQYRWSPWLTSGVEVRADWWSPQLPTDERRLLRVAPKLRLGRQLGLYASAEADGFYKIFPKYEVQDRKLDQQGVDSTLEAGYVFATYNRVAVGTELDYTQYLDARYDSLSSDGTVQRATRSKRYFERAPFVYVAVRPWEAFRANARYSFELNDATDYNRTMSGRTDGVLVEKFIRDYYDYERQRLTVNTQVSLGERLEIGTMGEAWVRDFNTYEARDTNNGWTGELRHDLSLEAGVEAAFQVLAFKGLGIEHGLYVNGFASYLGRRSNMKREVSIATNFEVTRIFVGVELRDL